MTAKYIRTKDNDIIVFPASLQHQNFKHFEPKSAGFISFFTNDEGESCCKCYGESESLELKSDPKDSRMAQFQLIREY